MTQQAGYALDQASKNDPAFRVRVGAERTLGIWIISGFRPDKVRETNNAQTAEPPLATPLPPFKSNSGLKPLPPPVAPPPPAPIPAAPMDKNSEPRPAPPLIPAPSVSKPLFSRSWLPLIPTKNSRVPKPDTEGPALNSPM
jgi:hypothetical protein